LPAVRRERAEPCRRARSAHQEVVPPAAGAHADPGRAKKGEIDGALGLVLGPLFRVEIHVDPCDLVFRQVLARELDDVLPVDDRADQPLEGALPPVRALGRRRQAETIGRETELGGKLVRRAREVMALVEDHEAEAIPEVLHVQVGRIVGRDGEGMHLVRAASHDPDLGGKARAEKIVPLANQVERRSDDQRAPSSIVDREHAEVALAGPGRQHHDPAAACAPKGSERLALKRARLPPEHEPRLELHVPASQVRERNAVALQGQHDLGVAGGRGPVAAAALVPDRAARRARPGVEPLELERPADERELDHQTGVSSRAGAPISSAGTCATISPMNAPRRSRIRT
jgi:hypothetical protein